MAVPGVPCGRWLPAQGVGPGRAFVRAEAVGSAGPVGPAAVLSVFPCGKQVQPVLVLLC